MIIGVCELEIEFELSGVGKVEVSIRILGVVFRLVHAQTLDGNKVVLVKELGLEVKTVHSFGVEYRCFEQH